MNYPVWAVPAPGLLIAAVAIVHVFISHFAVGGGLFLVLAERKARRDRTTGPARLRARLSRGFVLLTLVAGPSPASASGSRSAWCSRRPRAPWSPPSSGPGRSSGPSSPSRSRRRSSTSTAGTGSTRARHLAVGWIYAVSSWGSLRRDLRHPLLHADLGPLARRRTASPTASSTRPSCRWWPCAPPSPPSWPGSTRCSPPPSCATAS